MEIAFGITLPLNIGETIRYKFTVNGWNDQENFIPGGSCTNTNSAGLLIISNTIIKFSLAVVCFNSCTACVPQISYNITLKVNQLAILQIILVLLIL